MTVEELKGLAGLAEHGPRLGSHRAVIAKHVPTYREESCVDE